jgi:hypothetical protein
VENENLTLYIGDLTARNHTIVGLTNGRIYHIGVRAINPKGQSPMAGPIEAVPMTLPGPPGIVNAVADIEGILIEWKPPDDDGGSGVWYYYLMRTDEEGRNTTISVGGHVLRYLDTDVSKGYTYTYRIRAETSYGKGEFSAPVSVLFPEDEEETGFEIESFFIPIAGIVVLLVAIMFIFIAARITRRKKQELAMWEE